MSGPARDPGEVPGRVAAPMQVALTGGIASGKSTVADLFAALGVAVIDTDRLAHELTAAGGAAIRSESVV